MSRFDSSSLILKKIDIYSTGKGMEKTGDHTHTHTHNILAIGSKVSGLYERSRINLDHHHAHPP